MVYVLFDEISLREHGHFFLDQLKLQQKRGQLAIELLALDLIRRRTRLNGAYELLDWAFRSLLDKRSGVDVHLRMRLVLNLN